MRRLHRLYADTRQFHTRDLRIQVGEGEGVGCPGTNPLRIPREGYIRKKEAGHSSLWYGSVHLNIILGGGRVQCILKSRDYFANKGPSSQSYDFSSSHVCVSELDYKESWALKNWYFWTAVLEKTPESPLNCKGSQPVRPKGNQSWIFIERIDAEAEAPILWPPDVKSQLIWKDPDTGKDWGQEEKGATEDEMVVLGEAHWLKPPTLARHHSNHLHELFYDRRSW